MNKTKDFLKNTKLGQKLSDNDLSALSSISIIENYQSEQIIFIEEQPGTGFYIIQSGKVKIYKISPEGKEQILQIFTTGDHFAEVPAFDGGVFPVSAIALQPTQLLFFPRSALIQLLSHHPQIAISILAIFANHLRRFAQIIADLSLKEVPGRLAGYLLAFPTDLVELNMTKAQLASFLGTTPETLSRAFNKLSQQKIIEVKSSTIRLLDLEKLQVLATGITPS